MGSNKYPIKQYPQYKILVTSTTPTGSQAIRDTYQDKVLHYYFPFDLPLIVNRYVKKINPKICILLETECDKTLGRVAVLCGNDIKFI
jgi:3-deoxy-D-manno-octulosonic-acid transferase